MGVRAIRRFAASRGKGLINSKKMRACDGAHSLRVLKSGIPSNVIKLGGAFACGKVRLDTFTVVECKRVVSDGAVK